MIAIGGREFRQEQFPDGTLNMTDFPDSLIGNRVTITWLYRNIAEQVVLYNIVKHIRRNFEVEYLELELPYVPNARMDRTKHSTREVHTLRYFCDFINDLNFNQVYITDPHSDVTITLLDRATVKTPQQKVRRILEIEKIDYMFFPDKGAFHRYDYLIERTPFFGEKDRDWKTGKINGLTVHNPFNIAEKDYQGKSILIVDDISSYGGTFHYSAIRLKEMGFGEIFLFVTHAENNILKGDMINAGNIKKIYTTNSIYTGDHPLITTLQL